jgi:hypothetical protein
MMKQVPFILEGEQVIPFSQLNMMEMNFFSLVLAEHDIKVIRLASKVVEKAIPYPVYTYWMDYLQFSQDQPNPFLEV